MSRGLIKAINLIKVSECSNYLHHFVT